MATFINPRTDFGFKLIFGREETKSLLMNFLNGLLADEPGFEPIIDVKFLDKEMNRLNKEMRGVVYDILCTTDKDKNFIVEMQNSNQPFFIDRSVFYMSRAIFNQGQIGTEWKFNFNHVYIVSFLNFLIEPLDNNVRTDAMICNLATKKPITDKVRFIYIQLPKFNKTDWNECENNFELWIYLLKNMENMTTIPFAYKDTAFEKLSKIASYASLSPEDRFEYDQNLQAYRDYVNTVDFAKQEGIELGLKEGREKGLKEGREEGREEERNGIILAMHSNGLSLEMIATVTNTPKDKIRQILKL